MRAAAVREAPWISPIEQRDTHRLIPSKYGGSMLALLADDDACATSSISTMRPTSG
jgi:hypothetical protein